MKNLFFLLGLIVSAPVLTLAQFNSYDGAARPRIVNAVSATGGSVSSASKTAAVEQMAFDIINAKRLENGLKPLVWSESVAEVARMHSRNMAAKTFFSHRGLDNKMVSDRADEAGIQKWRAIGENIAFNRGYKDPTSKAVDLWLSSPSHRHNMFDSNWKESAIGVAIASDGSYYFTQVFLKR